MSRNPIKTALISVSDKSGVADFCRQLTLHNIRLLSTGGTAKLLMQEGIEVTEVSDHTGFPEIMDGRVKTLHPTIHAGILARRDVDLDVLQSLDIDAIDLVVVNLYPFEKTVADPDCSLEKAIENIDIGGPTMLRAAAKNHRDVTVVVDPQDYTLVLSEIANNDGEVSQSNRFGLATKCFQHTAKYDSAISMYLEKQTKADAQAKQPVNFPNTMELRFSKKQEMRYGENPHQSAAFYVENSDLICVANAIQVQGKALSYNNVADTDAALECVRQFDQGPACVIVKHANPCGVAISDSQLDAYERAYSTDTESAFGGIIAFNSTLLAQTVERILANQFVEVIVAPDVDPQALALLQEKQNVRVLKTGSITPQRPGLDYKRVTGGLLVQQRDDELLDSLTTVTQREPTPAEMDDMLFAWRVAKFVKSNAIVYAKNNMTIGVGAGQMSRINSARIAAIKAEHAGLPVVGAVMASDAFFPFRDGLDNAAKAGITAVIQPGGSMRDEEVIAAADEHDIAMLFTGMRHFRH